MRRTLACALGGVFVLVTCAAATAQDVWHDALLNWDFENFGSETATNFEVVVDAEGWAPQEVYLGQFAQWEPEYRDFDGNGDLDTIIKWTGAEIPAGQIAHVGLNMFGSGEILGAYWTYGTRGDQVLPIVYERTRVRDLGTGLSEIAMALETSAEFVLSGDAARLDNIRTFMNIPESMLGLPDINSSLDLQTLAEYETTPSMTQVALDDSPVFVTVGETAYVGPEWESLLVADVWLQSENRVIGRFWNLNPQSPEPGTLVLLSVGAAVLFGRRW